MKKWLALFLLVAVASFSYSAEAKKEKAEEVTAEEALKKLIDDNKRYVAGKAINPDRDKKRREEIAKAQHPFVVILTCSDSRVSPEVIFDQGLGDLFVIRTAGEVVDSLEIGSIEYAVEHLGAKLVVVLGHESCGAVSAAVNGGEMPKNIASIIEEIKPAVEKAKNQKGNLVDNAIINNVNLIVNKIGSKSDVLKEMKDVKVVGAVYSLTNSKVEFLKK